MTKSGYAERLETARAYAASSQHSSVNSSEHMLEHALSHLRSYAYYIRLAETAPIVNVKKQRKLMGQILAVSQETLVDKEDWS